MDIFDLQARIALTDSAAQTTQAAAWVLLGALGVLAGSFAFIRTMVSGDSKAPLGWITQLLFVTCVLAAYGFIFNAVIGASQGLADHFADLAGWHHYWDDVAQRFSTLSSGQGSQVDRLLGILQAHLMSYVLVGTYYLQFMVFLGIGYLAATFASILHVLGPLLIVGGLFANGHSLKSWFNALLQVALWPAVPPIIMLITVKGSEHALQALTDNTAFIISQNLILTVLTAVTPLLVAFLFGSAGVGGLAATVVGFAYGGVGAVTRFASSQIRSRFEDAGAAAAAVGAGGGSGTSGESAAQSTSPRPGDATTTVVEAGRSAPPGARPGDIAPPHPPASKSTPPGAPRAA